MISQEVGQGLPFWLPNGATIRRELERYIVDKELASGYQHVYTPPLLLLNSTRLLVTGIITKKTCSQLWTWVTGRICPSSNELPTPHPSLQTPCSLLPWIANPYRWNRYDAPLREIWCPHWSSTYVKCPQRRSPLCNSWTNPRRIPTCPSVDYRCLWRLQLDWIPLPSLSSWPQDTHKYFDNDEMWENAQTMLRAALDEMGVDYFEAEGEAAFYGPKLISKLRQLSEKKKPFRLSSLTSCFQNASTSNTSELMVKSTVQLWFTVGYSTMERFTAILIENYKGAFPTWLAPHCNPHPSF